MKRKNYIFLTTIHHTGTWFVGAILHGGFDYFFRCYSTELKPKHTGIAIKPYLTVYEHINDISIQEIREVYDLLNKDEGCLMVVPVRDVLAGIISARRRNPHLSITYVVRDFVLVAKEFGQFNPFFFPVDLYTEPAEREKMLTLLEQAIGMEMMLVDDLDKKALAETWEPRNESTDFCLRIFGTPHAVLQQAYEQKNIDYIKRELAEEWDYLMEKRAVLQPFFEKFGYKDLLWFEEETK